MYDALSYTWGTEDPVQKIIIRTPQEASTGTGKSRLQSFVTGTIIKKRVYVRPNLEDALRQFRDTQEDVLLWIDALCINQSDQEEKSRQVARMAEIYSRARDVLIWLGKEYNASSTAMEFIPKILDLDKSDALLISKESSRKQWIALADLLKREWFNRRWVVQELVLAKNRYLYCGDRSLNWSDFERAISFFTNRIDNIVAMFTNSAENRQNTKILVDVKLAGATALVQIMNDDFRWDEERLERVSSLESLVASLPMFESTDPRDTIYALLSIAADTQNWDVLPAHKRDELRVKGLVPFEADYSKNILEVYKDFIAFCILSSGSLDVLCRHWAPSEFRIPGMMYRMKMRAEKERSQADSMSDSTKDEDLSPMLSVTLPSWIGPLSERPFGIPDMGRSAGNSLVGVPSNPTTARDPRYHASAQIPASVRFGEVDASPYHSMF